MMRKYKIVDYDPSWPERFQKEANALKKIFTDSTTDIIHIGSTSVPGMAGKPQIDVLVLLDDIKIADQYTQLMQKAGYQAMGEVIQPNSRYFYRGDSEHKTVNIHMFPKHHPHVQEMIATRDYLRSHQTEAQQYSDLKKHIYRTSNNDYFSYRRDKDQYIKQLVQRAMNWRHSQNNIA